MNERLIIENRIRDAKKSIIAEEQKKIENEIKKFTDALIEIERKTSPPTMKDLGNIIEAFIGTKEFITIFIKEDPINSITEGILNNIKDRIDYFEKKLGGYKSQKTSFQTYYAHIEMMKKLLISVDYTKNDVEKLSLILQNCQKTHHDLLNLQMSTLVGYDLDAFNNKFVEIAEKIEQNRSEMKDFLYNKMFPKKHIESNKAKITLNQKLNEVIKCLQYINEDSERPKLSVVTTTIKNMIKSCKKIEELIFEERLNYNFNPDFGFLIVYVENQLTEMYKNLDLLKDKYKYFDSENEKENPFVAELNRIFEQLELVEKKVIEYKDKNKTQTPSTSISTHSIFASNGENNGTGEKRNHDHEIVNPTHKKYKKS